MAEQTPAPDTDALRALAADAKAWPFEEARKLLKRLEAKPGKTSVLFETGYGPSGLPHIGTFGEVARTAMVRHAFHILAPDIETHLIAFSDDMDGLRKVPPQLPEQEMLTAHLGRSLSSIPDPFGTHDSFSAHNNARLCAFLDRFGFDYEFVSSTAYYTSGRFDAALLRVLECFDAVMDIILPTLGEERRKTYSPFLPVCPKTGVVLQVPVIARDLEAGTITYDDPNDNERMTVPVTGGHTKLQWKADWAMRWYALQVDYEMAGKDLIDSVNLSSRILKVLGGTPPEGLSYELFLDEGGQKISKSKGNGLTIEDWLRYASPESLSQYMFQKPRQAKRLHFDIIPKTVDEYLTFLEKYPDQDEADRLSNPVWHIHGGTPPAASVPVSFSLLLNLVSASNSEDRSVLWGFIRQYNDAVSPETSPLLDRLVGYAITYYHDFVKPAKAFRAPSDRERAALEDLLARLKGLRDERRNDLDGEAIQSVVYQIGKTHGFDPLRDWFKALYEVLLGQTQGPRFGSFVALYGLDNSVTLIERALAGEDLTVPAAKTAQATSGQSAPGAS